ncbi:MAG TPA: Spy/CpxP family protein refolding chaperone [Bryobacteraceae bacterium]|nr:Spy/CpxP family protein refolding chaperone [Bryobacteraceae bacterium]
MQRRFLTASILLTLAALTLTTTVAFGQKSHTPPTPAQQIANRVARLTALLTLTTAQQAQATTIFTTEQTALAAVSANMKTARATLQSDVEANNTSGISAQASQIGTLTAQEVEATAMANGAFYAILTADQQMKDKNFGDGARGFGGRGGGFGGRGRRN